jgi:hypothetical protein
MRRLAVLAVAGVVLTACSGEQGERAQALLTGAQAAQSKLRSATYDARMTVTVDGQRFALAMDGGGYLKGRRAGDQRLTMRTEGVPGVGAVNMQMLVRRGQVSMTMNGKSFSLPASSAATTRQQGDWASAMVELSRFVKRVKVFENRTVNGEPGSTVTGVLDTAAMVEAASKLSAFGSAVNVDDLAGKLGDIHAALFVSRKTGLIRSAVITMSAEAEGKKASIELTYRLRSVNTAVPNL